MLYLLNQFCKRGHTATVVVNSHPIEPATLGHLELIPATRNSREYARCDVMLTHLDYSEHTMDMAEYWDKPCIHLIHNHISIDRFKLCRKSDLFIFAANWVLRECLDRTAEFHTTVCYPPVPRADFHNTIPLEERNAVLLSNLNSNKGGDLLKVVATAMPNVRFIGIQGAYGKQLFPSKDMKNVEIVPHTSNPTQYYDQARVVWCPSRYESFGMVAVEALHAGIPVVASETDGLLESVTHEGGQLIPLSKRDYIGNWIDPIRLLMTDDQHWQHWAQRARIRSLQLAALAEQQVDHTIAQIERVVVRARKGH